MKECVPWHTNCEGSCSSQRCCDGKLRTHIGGNVVVESTRVYAGTLGCDGPKWFRVRKPVGGVKTNSYQSEVEMKS
jgi:hypothetical protein